MEGYRRKDSSLILLSLIGSGNATKIQIVESLRSLPTCHDNNSRIIL